MSHGTPSPLLDSPAVLEDQTNDKCEDSCEAREPSDVEKEEKEADYDFEESIADEENDDVCEVDIYNSGVEDADNSDGEHELLLLDDGKQDDESTPLPEELQCLVDYANDKQDTRDRNNMLHGRSELDRRGAMRVSPVPSHGSGSVGPDDSSCNECKVSLTKWTIRSHPRMERLVNAILHDDMQQIAVYLESHLSYKMRGLSMPVEIKTRAKHIIRSKAMSLGHLIVLFSSSRTVSFLESKKLLLNAMFRTRCDFEVQFAAMDTKLGMDGTSDFRENYRGIPVSFMAAFRDNVATLKWLIKKYYFRRHAVELDSSGRNLLHFAVEEESPQLFKEILVNRNIFPWEILRNLLKTRDGVRDETPFARACSRAEPIMMILFVRNCPPDFVLGREDLSGMGKSVFNFVLSKVNNTSLSTQVVKEFLKRGSVPDQTNFDDTSTIESLIANEQFAAAELKRMVKLLLKYGAQPTNGALIKLLRLPFRTDEELFQLAKILLKVGGTRLLLNKQAHKLWLAQRKETNVFKPFQLASRDGQSVCIEILRNSTVTIAKMERLLILISQFADISAMFPDADGMAVAIGERMGLESTDDLYLDLESVLRLLIRFTCSYRVEDELRVFLNRLHRGILKELFERMDFSKAEKSIDNVTAFVLHCLDTMENLQFDFNALVDGHVGLFSVFHQNVPDEVVMKVLESLPKSFCINVQNGMFENIGSLVIKRYSENFQTVRKIFELLKTLDFDFTQTVHGGQTLLMLYVSRCGERFDQMQTEDRMTSYLEADFFGGIRFLFREKVDMMYQVRSDDFKKNAVMNVLSVSMTLSHSNIAEEILKLNPSLLDGVPVETVLAFIKQCPQVLEFLNGRSFVDEEKNCVLSQQESHDHTSRSFLKRNFNSRTTTDIRTTWLKYIQVHHEDILRFVGEEEQSGYSKQVELIYDYLVHTDIDDDEDLERAPKTVAMEFSVFRRPQTDIYDPTYKKDNKERVNAPLFLKIVDECQTIVKHPLFTEYFEKFYRKAFFNSVAFILFHILFLVLLNCSLNSVVTATTHNVTFELYGFTHGHYVCKVDKCYPALYKTEDRNSIDWATIKCDSSNRSACPTCMIHTSKLKLCPYPLNITKLTCPFTGNHKRTWIGTGLYLLLTMATIGLFREIVQFILDPLDYCGSYMQNAVEISMYAFVLLFSLNLSECTWISGFKQPWQFQIGAIAVLNSWFMMFFYMSKFPAFATYVIMFYQSVQSGLWLLITFFPLLCGFGFALHFLLKNQFIYQSMGLSLNKVWIMMAGEIDYKSTFIGQFKDEVTPEETVHFETLTRIILFLFVLLISIVLMNLFIGLIVGDVEKINKMAELKKWRWNLEFIEYTESMFDFLKKWTTQLRDRCRKNGSIRVLGQLERDRRSTVYLQQVESGRRRLLGSDSLKFGLYVTDLSWRNAFKWASIAKFFGFVDRKELIKRLMAVENRKRKLRKQYSVLRRMDPMLNTSQKEPENAKRSALPVLANPHNEVESDSGTESEVTIHSTGPDRLKKLTGSYGGDGADTGSTDSLASADELVPRHERNPLPRVLSSQPLVSNAATGDDLAQAAQRLGHVQYKPHGQIPHFVKTSASNKSLENLHHI